MKYLLVVITLLFSSFSLAEDIDIKAVYGAGWSKLTNAQQAAIMKSVADSASENVVKKVETVTETVDKVDKWVTAGERVGKMMGGAAKEVGVAVNEFVKTPVGQWTMVLVIWQYMGGAIVHIVGGLLILTIGLVVWLYIITRSKSVTVLYSSTKTDIFGRATIERVTKGPLSSDDVAFSTFFLIGFVTASLITTFTF